MKVCKFIKEDTTWYHIHTTCSVANAVVYPPNWATLKSPAVGQKTVRRWLIIGLLFTFLPVASLFFFKFGSFLLIQKSFDPFQ